jgi:hypothetical protein
MGRARGVTPDYLLIIHYDERNLTASDLPIMISRPREPRHRHTNWPAINVFALLFFSLGPPETLSRSEMVSRRKILSRSRDDLNLDQVYIKQMEEEEDVWYQKEKLFKVSLVTFFSSELLN